METIKDTNFTQPALEKLVGQVIESCCSLAPAADPPDMPTQVLIKDLAMDLDIADATGAQDAPEAFDNVTVRALSMLYTFAKAAAEKVS